MGPLGSQKIIVTIKSTFANEIAKNGVLCHVIVSNKGKLLLLSLSFFKSFSTQKQFISINSPVPPHMINRNDSECYYSKSSEYTYN